MYASADVNMSPSSVADDDNGFGRGASAEDDTSGAGLPGISSVQQHCVPFQMDESSKNYPKSLSFLHFGNSRQEENFCRLSS
jgi:hypothetical protein